MEYARRKLSVGQRFKRLKRGVVGVGHIVDYEPNAWFDVAAAIMVVIGGVEFNLSALEWIAVIFSICIVLVAMAINLAVEFLSEMPELANNSFSHVVSRLSATAVLVANISAFIVGLIIFIPKIFYTAY